MAAVQARIDAFADTYRAAYPAAVKCLLTDRQQLTAYLRFPLEHHHRIRHSNFISVNRPTLRQRATKGPGSRAAGIAMAFKLIQAAQARWRAVNAPHLVALVRAGARFEKGKLVERPDHTTPETGGDRLAS